VSNSGEPLTIFNEFHLQNSSCSPAAALKETECVGALANTKHTCFYFPHSPALFRLIIGTYTPIALVEINAWAFQVILPLIRNCDSLVDN